MWVCVGVSVCENTIKLEKYLKLLCVCACVCVCVYVAQFEK